MDTTEITPLSPRSLRRHHRDRIKHNRRYHWHQDMALRPIHWAQLIDTPTPCSCYCCGNPRKWFEQVTIQEKRFAERAQSSDDPIWPTLLR